MTLRETEREIFIKEKERKADREMDFVSARDKAGTRKV